MSAILKDRLGFADVIETVSFDDAVERLESAGWVQLAAFDLDMPGMQGPATLREIRKSFKVQRLVVVSASQARSDILGSLEAGVHGYVSKGQGVSMLQTALQEILEGKVYVPPALAEVSTETAGEAKRDKPTATRDTLPNLTPRQTDVLWMLIDGKSNKEIARALGLGHSTVKVHLAALFNRLGVTSRAAAAVAGARALSHRPGSSAFMI